MQFEKEGQDTNRMGWQIAVSLNGLSQLNVEFSSDCNKQSKCGFCGHQDKRIHPNLRVGQMSEPLLKDIASQVPPGIVVQMHRDGDPLAYRGDLGRALDYFSHTIRSLVSHGETLEQRADELIGHCESICVSVFKRDPDADLQFNSVKAFVEKKGSRLPRVLIKVVGDLEDWRVNAYERLSVPVMRRLLHIRAASRSYRGGMPQMWEHGLCSDLLHHPSIAWDGRVYLCNRLDTTEAGYIGSLYEQCLEDIWNGERRKAVIRSHIEGRRNDVPACKNCEYWGIPTS